MNRSIRIVAFIALVATPTLQFAMASSRLRPVAQNVSRYAAASAPALTGAAPALANQTRNFINFQSPEWSQYQTAQAMMEQQKKIYDSFSTKVANYEKNQEKLKEIPENNQRAIKKYLEQNDIDNDIKNLNTLLDLSDQLQQEVESGQKSNGPQTDIGFVPAARFNSDKFFKERFEVKNDRGNNIFDLENQHFNDTNNLYNTKIALLKESRLTPGAKTTKALNKVQFDIDNLALKESTKLMHDLKDKLKLEDPFGFDAKGNFVGSGNGGMFDKNGNMIELD